MHDGDRPRGGRDSGHLACPYCGSYDVDRLFVASVRMDSCQCLACRSRWDEELETGTYRGRSDGASVLIRGERR